MEKHWLDIKTAKAILEEHKDQGKMIYCARCPECKKYIFGHYDTDLIAALPTICPECKAVITMGN